MKTLKIFLLMFMFAGFMVSCGGETPAEETTEENADAPVDEETDAPAKDEEADAPVTDETDAPAEEDHSGHSH